MEALLDRKSLSQYVKVSPAVDDKTGEDGDRKARAYMLLNIEDDQFKFIRNCVTAKSVWIALAAEHESKTFIALIELETRYGTIQWKQGKETLGEFLDRFLDLVRQLDASGSIQPEQTRVRKLMSLMPHQYRSVAHKLDQYPTEKAEPVTSCTFVA